MENMQADIKILIPGVGEGVWEVVPDEILLSLPQKPADDETKEVSSNV